MRLSGLVLAVLLSTSVALFAQHSSGGGGSSHAASFSGSSGSGFSHTSATSPTSSTPAPQSSSSQSSSKSTSTKTSLSPEKKTSRSFFHPFRKPVQNVEFKTCVKGPCAVCPPGQSRGGASACVTTSNACSVGQSFNGFTCGTQGWLFNDCSSLAQQLAAQKRLMQGQNDYGQGLRLQMLRNQYQQCLMRSRSPFGAYAYNAAFLLDTP